MHFKFSLYDEVAIRDSFFDEVTIRNLKDSFEQTLGTLPEPLIVCQEQNVVYANKAFSQVVSQEEEEQKENPPITKETLA